MNFHLEERNYPSRIKRPAECLQHFDGPNRNGSHEDRVMAKRQLPSPEVLRQLIRYEPETGKLFWKERGPEWFKSECYPLEVCAGRWNTKHAGRPALDCISEGYKVGNMLGRRVLAHRAAWAIYYGKWPADQIDHINGDGTDNRIANLREATNAENQQNLSMRQDNRSGFLGVSWHSAGGKWRASIRSKGQIYHLGLFEHIFDAAAAYRLAKKRLHTFCPDVRQRWK